MLLDYYYSTENPIPSSDDQVMRVCCAFAGEEREAVKHVLGEFFNLTENGYINNRVEQELEKRRDISEKRKKAVEVREANRASSDTSNDDTSTSTSTSTSITTTTSIKPPKHSKETMGWVNEKAGELDFEDMWVQYPRQRRGSKDKAKVAYRGAVGRASHDEIYSGVMAYAASDEVERGFAKGCAAWLNDDRWTSDYSIQTGEPKKKTTLELRDEILNEMNGDTLCLTKIN
jgi:uncharacterized protein YdaU (DUF1376 family)